MRISEIFYSIQGEGKLAGVPSLFIRVAGCNLRCTWCDTPYASWDAGKQGDGAAEMSIEEIAEKVARIPEPIRHAVLTGGEPMMFKEAATLITALKKLGKHITVETAGTLWLDNLPVGGIDLASISPKLANSTPHDREGGRFAVAHDKQRINLEVLKKFATEAAVKECQWKFVISAAANLTEMEQLIGQLNIQLPDTARIPNEDILLMPEGIDAETLRTRARWLAEVCKEKGYRLSPRLQVELWGNTRGT